jgi:pimeloyl-ACP methyl ester carboxylesterase
MPTILYVHGLEAGPEGRKSVELRRVGLTVVAHQMPCGQRHVVRDPVVVGTMAFTVGGLALVGRSFGARAAAGAALGVGALTPFALSRVMRRVFARSLDVQRQALRRQPIDAIVASSFGGAVTLSLLLEGTWRGPTVLLCPAHELVDARAWRPSSAAATLTSLPDEVASRVLVVHGTRDETVPLASSERLVRGSAARLEIVEDDHRLRATATGEQMQRWLEQVGVVR